MAEGSAAGALLLRGLEQDRERGSAVPSSAPRASSDVLLGPLLGAELEPGKDTHSPSTLGLFVSALLRVGPLVFLLLDL